jgi:hypothetical protein
MDGFQWALKGESTCINLYFPGWTLNTKGKFVGAMIGVIGLAIATEAISKVRHTLSGKVRRADVTRSEIQKISLMQTGLHGLHALTGYILMLATMTFSLEILICVIIGLMIGYVLFAGDTYSHVTTNPCCAFLEDEANERAGPGPSQENACCETKAAENLAVHLESGSIVSSETEQHNVEEHICTA